MAEGLLPPQLRTVALSAAGGGFVGALLAIILAWIFAGSFCCDHEGEMMRDKPAAAVAVGPADNARLHPPT